MRRLILGLMAVIACSDSGIAPICGVDGRADPECHTLPFDGVARPYLLHVPSSYHAGGSLVIALHGVGELGPRLRDISQLSETADAEGFAIAYPNATVASLTGFAEWNVYFSESFGPNPPDDVGFLRALVAQLRTQLSPDAKRIYVVGLSNGGLMVHRVAAEMSDVVAAVVDVTGTIATTPSTANVHSPASGVSVLMLHGDADDVVPCCEFRGAATIDDSFAFWAGGRGDACSAVSTTAPICEAPETPSALPSKRATSCRDGSEVQFYMLFGGRHGWYQGSLTTPGTEGYNPLFADSIGTTMNAVIWHWFATHPKS